ncbi:hypothetical protein SLA2020_447320 [Shorea laevis]
MNQSSKIGALSWSSPVFTLPEEVMVPVTLLEVALLLVIALEEVCLDGLFPMCPIDVGSFLFPPRPEALVA